MKKIIFSVIACTTVAMLLTNCKKDKIEPNEEVNNDPLHTMTADTLETGYEEETIGEITGTPNVVLVHLGDLPSAIALPMPPIKNQGRQGSCTAWAVTYYLMSYLKHQAEGSAYFSGGNPDNSVLCSPAYTFNQVKAADPDTDCSGSGAIQHLTKLKSQGACTLDEMPYNQNNCALQPNAAQIAAAANNKISEYFKIDRDNIPLLKIMLALEQPLVFAIKSNATLKNLNAPYVWTQGAAGTGHSVTLSGYSDGYGGFQITNSWGKDWGDDGKFYMTYSAFQDLPNGKYCFTAFWKSNPALNDLDNGLASHYLLNGNLEDEVGSDATSTGVTPTTDRNGVGSSAMLFNGTSSYAENSYDLENNGFSISCWIRPETSVAGQQVIFSQVAQNASPNYGIELLLDHDTIKIDMPIGSGRVKLGGNQKITPGNWYHIAVTFDEKFIRLYVNGAAVVIGVCTEFFDAPSSLFNLGSRLANGVGVKSNFYTGKIDDLRIYSRAINDAEVDELFEN